ncbi:hypothetical protein [Aquimarina sp. RZ0]|uniref:hypothetical protein n=1 Tax=Aquimarina sp. RZ0 TaxID=2607730 RepID=UPI0011F2C552|nr:hypothetical protein [Aquimarina sp. RZ0]KAA1243761.1 hypothetical protein F0000_19545 [Aquimarina sp. RZ0]
MKTEYIVLKETILNNNCPECYATESLLLSFKQEKVFSRLVIKTKKTIVEQMDCKQCETTIFPGRWTDDIERVYEYHKKTLQPKPSSTRFTNTTYLLLLLFFLLCLSLSIYLYRSDFL